MIKLTRVLTYAEYEALQEKSRQETGYIFNSKFFPPGTAWFEPWIYDPTGEWERQGKHVVCKQHGSPHLSIYYWRDWSDKRAPICIAGPTGQHWEIDRKSSNGEGWQVTGDYTGDAPNITCSPSIVLDGYHGYLRNGEFTPDLEGRN
jgi:hypothetical protein